MVKLTKAQNMFKHKWIFIVLIIFLFAGCMVVTVDYTLRDVAYIITIKVDNKYSGDDYEYRYWYKIKTEGNLCIGWYSNKNYGVGDTIWMGARWGKHYEQQEE